MEADRIADLEKLMKRRFLEIRANAPKHWDYLGEPGHLSCKWRHSLAFNLTVAISVAEYDGLPWVHASIAHRKRMLTYEELKKLKDEFIGDDHPAYMVLPVAEQHVNIHPNCLHLFSPIGFTPLPDFTCGTGSI